MFTKIRNPNLYHGEKKKRNFFEGWYFKVCDQKNQHVFAFIPGIFKGKSDQESHSFLQVLEGRNALYSYLKYSKDDFGCKKNQLDVSVRDNNFSLEKMTLNLVHKNKKIKGSLRFKNIKKWPDSLLNPGSMGFYNYLWFMECYSHVCVHDGCIEGQLQIGKKTIDFTGGKVYIEKNWGRSFPKSSIWLQSNSFAEKETSFTCSMGKVPFLFGSFSGFLAAVNIGEKFYPFTTINQSTMSFQRSDMDVEIFFKKKNLELHVKTICQKNEFINCLGPKDGQMIPLTNENLTGEIELELRDTKSQQNIYYGKGKSAGIEYGGETMLD